MIKSTVLHLQFHFAWLCPSGSKLIALWRDTECQPFERICINSLHVHSPLSCLQAAKLGRRAKKSAQPEIELGATLDDGGAEEETLAATDSNPLQSGPDVSQWILSYYTIYVTHLDVLPNFPLFWIHMDIFTYGAVISFENFVRHWNILLIFFFSWMVLLNPPGEWVAGELIQIL